MIPIEVDSKRARFALSSNLIEQARDRFIGAQGVIRSLIDRGAIGLVTTHDLALTAIDVGGAERLRNLHFQDEIVDGRMQFDFKRQESVVTKSNGIELMRSIGLTV